MKIKLKTNETFSVTTSSGGTLNLPDIENGQTDVAATKKYVDDLFTSISYVAIDITKFTSNKTVVEQGTKVTDVTLTWQTNKEPESPNGTDPAAKLDNEAITLTGTTGTIEKTGLNITDTKQWRLDVYDAGVPGKDSAHDYATVTLNYYNRRYWGAKAEGTLNSAFIKSLATNGDTKGGSELVANMNNAKEFTVNAGSGEYIWFAVPKSFGQCKFEFGGQDVTFTEYEVDYELPDHTTQNPHTIKYYVYRNDNTNLGETKIKALKK